MKRFLAWILSLTGLAAVIFVALAFTPYPFRAYRWLGSDPAPLQAHPDYIVLLSGGGIPSESGLMRAYRAAEVAEKAPSSRVIIAMTVEGREDGGSFSRMRRELMMRGVMRERMLFEKKGRNTREQAINIKKLLERNKEDPVLLLVTSPEHLRRSLLTFRKAGFGNVHGASAFGTAVAADFRYKSDDLGGQPAPAAPDLGGNLVARYILWDNLITEVKVCRELAALMYYRARGWI